MCEGTIIYGCDSMGSCGDSHVGASSCLPHPARLSRAGAVTHGSRLLDALLVSLAFGLAACLLVCLSACLLVYRLPMQTLKLTSVSQPCYSHLKSETHIALRDSAISGEPAKSNIRVHRHRFKSK